MKKPYQSIILTFVLLFTCLVAYLEWHQTQFNPVSLTFCLVGFVLGLVFSALSIRTLLKNGIKLHRIVLLISSAGAFALNSITIVKLLTYL